MKNHPRTVDCLSRVLRAGIVISLLMPAGAAFAQLQPAAPPVIVISPQVQPGIIDTLRNQQRRDVYQEQQRQMRDADRNMITRSTPRLDVPVVRPNCIPTGRTISCR